MSLNKKLLAQAKNAGEVADHSVTKKGFGARIPEKGVAFARLIGYVELGDQPGEYEGKPKDPAPKCNLTFEVYGKKNKDTFEKDGKEETSYRLLRITNLLISNSPKSRFNKLFKDMAYGRDLKNMGEMLSDVFKVTIEHNKVKDRTYANLKAIGGPFKEETDDDGEVELVDMTSKIKPTAREYQFFQFDAPTMDMWDSLFIEGEREVTEEVDGEKVVSKQSNNFIQELIMDATNFEGSGMEALLAGMGEEEEIEEEDDEDEEVDVEDIDLDEDDEEEEVEEAPKKKKVAAKTAAKKSKKAEPSAKTATKSPSKKKAKKEVVEDIDEDEMIEDCFDDED